MRIVDKRGCSRGVPAVEALIEIVQHLPERYTRGIKRLVLMDRDYHEHGDALARYMEIEGTHSAEIELYLDDFLDYPDVLLDNRFLMTWQLSVILLHEIYHHVVRGLHEKRKPSDKREEADADRWALTEARKIFEKVFPAVKYKKELRDAGEFIKKMKKGIFVWTVK